MRGWQIRPAQPARVERVRRLSQVSPEADNADNADEVDNAGAGTGREIVNPVSGERIIIRQSGAQTGGKLLAFDLYLPPGGHVPAGHAHPVQEERFTVMEGRMRFRLGRRTILAQPGQTIIIPRGAAHWFGNAGAGVAHARVEVRPALRMQELFETTEALGQAPRTHGAWLMELSGLARVVLEFQREIAVPHIPAPLVRLALGPLAWVGRSRSATARRS